MARLLGEAGIPTVLVARRVDRLREIADRYDGFEVLEADLGTAEGRAACAERIMSAEEPIDLVVNNAGFGTSGVFHELDVERLEDEIELNVSALTTLSHAALSVMVPRRRGFLLNVSSVAGFQAGPGLAVYSATKAYVTSLTEALHEEVRSSGVHVTALCPGPDEDRVPAAQQHPELFVHVSRLRVDVGRIRRRDRARRRRQESHARGARRALQGDGRRRIDHAALHHPPHVGHGRPHLSWFS